MTDPLDIVNEFFTQPSHVQPFPYDEYWQRKVCSLADKIAKLEDQRDELIYYQNMWSMALVLVGLPEDASGGAFRDRIAMFKKYEAFWEHAREVDKEQFIRYEHER